MALSLFVLARVARATDDGAHGANLSGELDCDPARAAQQARWSTLAAPLASRDEDGAV